MTSMNDLWTKIKEYYEEEDPEGLDDLNPPASDDDIKALENGIGASLPKEFIDCLKIHNGQTGYGGFLFGCYELFSCERILEEWLIWKDLLESGAFEEFQATPGTGVKDCWWSLGWIPFAGNGGGDHLCLDLTPGEQGRSGQILSFWHDDPSRAVIADSFSDWFARQPELAEQE